MVDMSCEEHDRQAASTQFITHTVGRVLGAMQLSSTEINTKGFDALLNLVNNTAHDSFELYYGLFMYNQNATGKQVKRHAVFAALTCYVMLCNAVSCAAVPHGQCQQPVLGSWGVVICMLGKCGFMLPWCVQARAMALCNPVC